MSNLDRISERLAERRLIGEEIVAENLDAVATPRDWDKAVNVAYLRLNSATQAAAAKGAGLGVRTLRRWELSPWWPDACGEAVGRWMQQLEIECRTTIMGAVKAGDVVTAVKMLERIDQKLAPPRQSHGVEHRGEIAAKVKRMSDAELVERAAELVGQIPASMLLTNGAEANGAG